MPRDNIDEEPTALKLLVFQLHHAKYTQDAIAAYVGKSKGTINEMLKPLQKRKED